MKNFLIISLIATSIFLLSACEKQDENDLFEILTNPVWASDSLLVDGFDASGPGEILEKFKGNAKFNKDGSGYFGAYSGQWRFDQNRTEIIITTDSLPIPLGTRIAELNTSSLKITTAYPSLINPNEEMKIRMTFKAQ